MLETITMEKFRTYPRQKSWRVKTQGQMTALDRIREHLQQEVDARKSGLLPQDSPSSEDRGLWSQSAIRHAPLKTDNPLRRDSRSEERTSTIHKLTHSKRDMTTESFGVKRSASLQKPSAGRRPSLEPERKVRPSLASPKAQAAIPARREHALQQRADPTRKSTVQSCKPAVLRSQIADLPDNVNDEMMEGDGQDRHDDDGVKTEELSESDNDDENRLKSSGYRNGFIRRDVLIHDEKVVDESDFFATEDVDASDIEGEGNGESDSPLSSATKDGNGGKIDRHVEIVIKPEKYAGQENECHEDPDVPPKSALPSSLHRGYMINKDSDCSEDGMHIEFSEDDSASEDGSSDYESSPELYPEKQSAVNQRENMEDFHDTHVFDSGIGSEKPEEIASEDFDEIAERSALGSELIEEKTLNESVEYACSEEEHADKDEFTDQLVSKDLSMGNLLGKYLVHRDVPLQKDVVDTTTVAHSEAGGETLEEEVDSMDRSDHAYDDEAEIVDCDTDNVFHDDHTSVSGDQANETKEETPETENEEETTDTAEKTLAHEKAFSDYEIYESFHSDVKDYFRTDSEFQQENVGVGDDESETILINDMTSNPESNKHETEYDIEEDIEQTDNYTENFIDHSPEQDVRQRETRRCMEDVSPYKNMVESQALTSLGKMGDIISNIGGDYVEEDVATRQDAVEVTKENTDVIIQSWGFRVDPARPFTILQFLYRYVITKLWLTKARHYVLSGRPLWLTFLLMLTRFTGVVGLYVLIWMFKFFCICLAICIAAMIYAPYILGLVFMAIAKKVLARYGHYSSKDVQVFAWRLLGELSRVAMQVLQRLAVLCLHGLHLLVKFILRKIKQSKFVSRLKRFS